MPSLANGSPQFASAVDEVAASERENANQLVASLASQKERWATTTCIERMDLLNELIRSLGIVADEWVAACCQAKGHVPGTPPYGEEWLTGPCLVVRNLRLLRESISSIERDGRPKLPKPCSVRSDGQVVAPVFPTGIFDSLLFSGYSAEIWMQPDVSLANVTETMAVSYRAQRTCGVCLVLGAGNVSSIGPMDALYKLFVENRVVLLKMNPVNDYLTDIFARAMRALVDNGFLHIIKGNAAMGKYLCEHKSIDSIHVTGSDKTHDAIVFGTGDDGLERKRRRESANAKTMTSELGNVSPVIVVPGPWKASDLSLQAENIASMLVNNAGFNCNAARVLLTHSQWPQREALLSNIEEVFSNTPARRAYYPGAQQRHEAFVAQRDNVGMRGQEVEGTLPWTLIRSLDPADTHEICFTTEAFCSIMGETALSAISVLEYLRKAVDFANECLWGSLNVTLIVHPDTLKDHHIKAAFEKAIADLRYGTVAINHWAGLNFGLVATTWGAFPGHPPHDIQSGTGVVHNTYMFDRPQKTVLRGPFRPFPKPLWFATHRKTHRVGPALFRFESSPSLTTLPAVVWNALG